MSRNLGKGAGAVLALAFALSASGYGDDLDPPARHVTSAEGTPTPTAVEGTWEAAFSAAGTGQGSIRPGKWILKLKGDRYEIDAPGGDVTRGAISWADGFATFSNDARCIEADGFRGGPGTYNWSVTGDQLSFQNTALKEICDPRKAILPTHPWRRVSRSVRWKAIPDRPATALAPGATGIDPGQAIPASLAEPTPRRLLGTYKSGLPEGGQGGLEAGTYRLVLRPRSYQIRFPGGNVSKGELRWSRTRATFGTDTDCAAASEEQARPGTYFWSARKGFIDFALAGRKDPCDFRMPVLATNLWRPVSESQRFLPEPPAVAPDPKLPIPRNASTPVNPEIAGKYEAVFTEADVAGKGETPTGRWTLALKGRRYRIVSPTQTIFEGQALWNGNRVTLTRDTTCLSWGKELFGPGTYFWSGDAESVAFSYTGAVDACNPRGPAITTKRWTRRDRK